MRRVASAALRCAVMALLQQCARGSGAWAPPRASAQPAYTARLLSCPPAPLLPCSPPCTLTTPRHRLHNDVRRIISPHRSHMCIPRAESPSTRAGAGVGRRAGAAHPGHTPQPGTPSPHWTPPLDTRLTPTPRLSPTPAYLPGHYHGYRPLTTSWTRLTPTARSTPAPGRSTLPPSSRPCGAWIPSASR